MGPVYEGGEVVSAFETNMAVLFPSTMEHYGSAPEPAFDSADDRGDITNKTSPWMRMTLAFKLELLEVTDSVEEHAKAPHPTLAPHPALLEGRKTRRVAAEDYGEAALDGRGVWLPPAFPGRGRGIRVMADALLNNSRSVQCPATDPPPEPRRLALRQKPHQLPP